MSSKLASGGTVEFVLERRPGAAVHVWKVVDLKRKPGREPTLDEAVEAGLGPVESSGRKSGPTAWLSRSR